MGDDGKDGIFTTRLELSSMKEDMMRREPVLRTVGMVALAAGPVALLRVPFDALGRSKRDRACRATRLQIKQTCCCEAASRLKLDCPTCLARMLLHLL